MKKSDYMQLPRRLSTLEFAFWSASACYYAYIVMYLSRRGYSNTAIGAIMSLTAIISIISPPIWGYISDRTKSINKVIAACILLTAVSIIVLPFLNQLWAITVIMAIIAFTDSPNSPLLDSLVMQNMHRMTNTSYGSIRLWGSIGYAIVAYAVGVLIEVYGSGIMFISYCFFAIFVIKIVLSLPNPAAEIVEADAVYVTDSKPDVKVLFSNPRFVLFLVFGSLLFTPHKASMTFLPQLFNTIHGTSAQLGAAWFISAASEAPILFLGQRLNARYKPLQIILISSVFFIARQFIYAFTYAPWLAILNQILQGLSFGLFLTGTVYYINETAPEGLKATAQAIATASYMGVSGILGNYLGGVIIDHFGIYFMYKAGIILDIIAASGFMIFLIIFSKKETLEHSSNP